MQFKNRFYLLFERFLLLLAFYSICRLLFFVFNFSYFRELPFSSTLRLFMYGLRFDVTAIIISNLLFIILHFLPFQLFYHRIYQVLLRFLFIMINSAAILMNLIDVEFFRFGGKRATSDAFKVMSFGEDFANTAPKMLRDFWYVLLIFIILVIILYNLYGKIKLTTLKKRFEFITGSITGNLALALLTAGLCFTGFRGGIQYRPINIMTASRYASGNDAALVLNTPFTVLKTLGKNTLEPRNYFTETEAKKISPVVHQAPSGKQFRKQNVVILVAESLGKEYVGALNNYEGYTPFLDSLISHSLVYSRAYANGKRSIEGIPCIVAGLPAFMTEAFITSAYNGNHIYSIATALKSKGYQNLFFHGGTNGTMGFDNFTKLAGYDHYYGRKEYNNDKDFDGSWGIFDEPFLEFSLKKLDETPEPFQATIFTISAHHPYKIPEHYKGKFKKGTLPIHESLMYADYSMKNFFEEARKSKWFDSTLFVITGDHTALSEYPFYQNQVGMYSVPVIYYHPHDSITGESTLTTQQIDIIPSILDYLQYDEPYFAFGKSVFDTTDHFAVNFINDIYQVISGGYSVTMDTSRVIGVYHFENDSALLKNLKGRNPDMESAMTTKLKAFVQNYNDAMINNTMTIK